MNQNGTHDPNPRPNESTVAEPEAPIEQEDALESLLGKVDMSAPLEIPLNSGQIFEITQEQFISYYLPPDATRAEKAKCFNETRAVGLNPAVRGDCHYFRAGGGPLALFVGYHVYVRLAYANGLNHIHKPELVYDDDTGSLESCIITLEIEGRPDFIWETWLSEVIGENKGTPNQRWTKAERQMLIKCSVINTLRMAGIATLGLLPPTTEEMPDFSASGFRTLTQPQLDAHSVDAEQEEPTVGAVNAAEHQMDMSKFRKSYFTALGKRNILQGEDERQDWQEERVGKRHTSDWSPADYSTAMDIIHTIPIPEAPADGDAFLDGLPDTPEKSQDAPNKDAEGPSQPDPQPEPEKARITPLTRATLTELVNTFPDARYMTIRSKSFKIRAKDVIDREVTKTENFTETEALAIIESLEKEKAALSTDSQGWFESIEYATLATAFNVRVNQKWESVEDMMAWQEKYTGQKSRRNWLQEHFEKANAALDAEESETDSAETAQPTNDELVDGEGKCTEEQFDKIKVLASDLLPGAKDAAGNSVALGTGRVRGWIRAIIAPDQYVGVMNLTTAKANDVILGFQDRITDRDNQE